MRVWIIEIGEPLPDIDGNFRYFRCGLLSKALVTDGHQVIWWTSTFNYLERKHRFNGPRTIEIQPGLILKLLHGPGYNRSNSLKRFWYHRVMAKAFAQEAFNVSDQPDVVFCCLPTLELAEEAVNFGQKTGTPVIIDIRDLWPDHYLTLAPTRFRNLFKVALFTEFQRVRRILKGATGITAISNTFLNWALRYAGREKSSPDGVFPMGYPAQSSFSNQDIQDKQAQLISNYQINPDNLLITFVGTFTPSYALDTVIEAARLLYQTTPSQVQFIIIGDGDEGYKLHTQAQGLNNIIFTGWLDQLSIVSILGLSSVGLAPYRHDASMSLPNKPFEYMARELPVLSSLRGELEILIRQEKIGLQYQANNVASLVESIHWFLNHPDEKKAMGMRARKLLEEKFSVEVVYPRLIEHLENIAT
ncbi:MAG: glycosyltransferase family 4 protein [Anaerolineae bacterium]|nr:glycosyltransferase family 4 protein [Anaerolineae bacterium]